MPLARMDFSGAVSLLKDHVHHVRAFARSCGQTVDLLEELHWRLLLCDISCSEGIDIRPRHIRAYDFLPFGSASLQGRPQLLARVLPLRQARSEVKPATDTT